MRKRGQVGETVVFNTIRAAIAFLVKFKFLFTEYITVSYIHSNSNSIINTIYHILYMWRFGSFGDFC